MLGRVFAAAIRGKRAPSKGFWLISSKRGAKNFYKGKGCAPTGRHTRKGNTSLSISLLNTNRWVHYQSVEEANLHRPFPRTLYSLDPQIASNPNNYHPLVEALRCKRLPNSIRHYVDS